MRYGSARTAGFHGGRLGMFSSAQHWLLRFSAVTVRVVDPAHVHLGGAKEQHDVPR